MTRRALSRPSFRLTRRANQGRPGDFIVEVWNPFVRAYQPVASVRDGLRRVGELADLIGRMWSQRHPKRDVLEDVPSAAAGSEERWAEFRVNGAVFRSYDTRYNDRPAWVKSAGLMQAATTTCARVGYAPPASAASWSVIPRMRSCGAYVAAPLLQVLPLR